jgi:hypothetical protein
MELRITLGEARPIHEYLLAPLCRAKSESHGRAAVRDRV